MIRAYITVLLLGVLVAIGTTSCSKQETIETAPGRQMMCPVMKGEKINPNHYVDADGKRIYACCPGCVVKIKADSGKYIAQLEAEGVVLEETPTVK